jgi:anti-sigma regulatory factor (Ser/Thr protein kinase)
MEPERIMVQSQDRFELDSQLTELSRVQGWIEAVGDRHGLPPDARVSIQLRMEEVLANVVQHGYREEPGHLIVISSSTSGGT